jgi:hypothetical protein
MASRPIHIAFIAVAMIITMAGAATSHEATKGANGGALVDVDGHHVEFVPSDSELTFYLTDANGAPLSTAQAKMKAIVQIGGKTTRLELSPSAPNKLTAPLETRLGQGAKVVLSGVLPDGHSLQGRFVVP